MGNQKVVFCRMKQAKGDCLTISHQLNQDLSHQGMFGCSKAKSYNHRAFRFELAVLYSNEYAKQNVFFFAYLLNKGNYSHFLSFLFLKKTW